MAWNTFPTKEQKTYSLIPAGTMAKVKMYITRGGYDNIQHSCTGGYASYKPESGYIFLDARFLILAGTYANRWVRTYIGLHSDKTSECGRIAGEFIKDVLSSAKGLRGDDDSDLARALRETKSLADLDGLEFVGQIEIEKRNAKEYNIIKKAITADNKAYQALMSQQHTAKIPPIVSATPRIGYGNVMQQAMPKMTSQGIPAAPTVAHTGYAHASMASIRR
jgi:hypothetical protein